MMLWKKEGEGWGTGLYIACKKRGEDVERRDFLKCLGEEG